MKILPLILFFAGGTSCHRLFSCCCDSGTKGGLGLIRSRHGYYAHQKLIDASMQILHKAIHNIRGGMRISDIGFLIETEAPVVDLVLFSDKVDMRRALFSEKKILDLKPVQMDDVGFIWIHLVGYDRPIKYAY